MKCDDFAKLVESRPFTQMSRAERMALLNHMLGCLPCRGMVKERAQRAEESGLVKSDAVARTLAQSVSLVREDMRSDDPEI